jgi:N-acyl-D-aspartate/D-glutamate deacylase
VFEMISDFPDLDAEFAIIRNIVEVSGQMLTLSLAQGNRSSEAWRDVLAKIAEAQADGLPIRAQVAPRPIGVLLGLQATLNPFAACPTFRSIAAEPLAAKVAAMRDPAFRERVLAEKAEHPRWPDFDRLFPLGDPPDYEPPRSANLTTAAERLGCAPAEVAYDLLLEDDGRNLLFAPFANYADFGLDATREMLVHPDTVIGLGDGGAHVGTISDGSFPTYALSHWGRDREHGRMDVGWLIEQQTSRTARTVGLFDRGVLGPGLRADVNVIDFERLRCERPEMTYDLPAGGKRLLQRATGYTATLVAGQVIARDGEPTGALPGRLVRGPQAAPTA